MLACLSLVLRECSRILRVIEGHGRVLVLDLLRHGCHTWQVSTSAGTRGQDASFRSSGRLHALGHARGVNTAGVCASKSTATA